MESPVTVIGNAGKNAEMRFTTEGKAVTSVSVATYSSGTKANNNQVSVWVRVSFWGEVAEQANSITKGQKLIVRGRFTPVRIWEKDSKPQANIEMTGDSFEVVQRQETTPF
jgi:single-strand DNA-binding protein